MEDGGSVRVTGLGRPVHIHRAGDGRGTWDGDGAWDRPGSVVSVAANGRSVREDGSDGWESTGVRPRGAFRHL